jgi:hypothetical protein
MELAVVGEQNDLAGQLLLGRDADRVVDLAQQTGPLLEPAFVNDDQAEVQVDLVAGLDEVVDGRDSLGDP